jgi:hypothetical protein
MLEFTFALSDGMLVFPAVIANLDALVSGSDRLSLVTGTRALVRNRAAGYDCSLVLHFPNYAHVYGSRNCRSPCGLMQRVVVAVLN